MSEDRLEQALHEMRTEDVDAGTIETARARVWEKVTNAGGAVCAEFRQEFRAYLGKELGASRRLLVEDHLSRCPSCRTRIAEMKGERTVIAMPAFAKATARQAPPPAGCDTACLPRPPRYSSRSCMSDATPSTP